MIKRSGCDPWRKVYLGDGLYADYDGFSLWLTAENGIEITARVCLEPEVYRSLVEYVASLDEGPTVTEIARGGIFPNVPMDDYVRDRTMERAHPYAATYPPSLNASIAHLLVTRSPAHARHAHPRLNLAWQPRVSDDMDLGTIAHALLLENDASRLYLIDADDFRGKAARNLRDDARAKGLIPVLAHREPAIRQMVLTALEALHASELAPYFDTEPAPRVEHTMVWQDDGAWHRSRPDWLLSDARTVVVLDFKTTATLAEPDTWSRGPMLAYGYDIQAALAMRGVRAILNPTHVIAAFLVQEVTPPFACSLIGMAPRWVEFANAKLDRARALWRECLTVGQWPGYSSRVMWVDPPTYAWESKQAVVAQADSGEGVVEEL